MESTVGYAFTPCVRYFTFPGADTRDQQLIVSLLKDADNSRQKNYLSFETVKLLDKLFKIIFDWIRSEFG